METRMSTLRSVMIQVLSASRVRAGTVQTAQAGWIATPEVVAPAAVATAADVVGAQARLNGLLDRDDVVQALTARGVDLGAARERVASLSDAQAAQLLAQIDSAPAGGDSALGIIVFIFVLLLITDILGFTKVFPFTRSVR
jgi:hypothetical protein